MNSQGSRKAKELLLADDYDGLVQIAEDQVQGGAHVLDLCVALTERTDEDEQMRLLAKKHLADPARADPDRLDRARGDRTRARADPGPGDRQLGQPRGRAARSSTAWCPLALAHGAALIALDDRRGRGWRRPRSASSRSPSASASCAARSTAWTRELLIFDCLTFTLTTGEEEWRPSAVETIAGIRLIKQQIPGVKTSLGVSNVSFGVSPPAHARC